MLNKIFCFALVAVAFAAAQERISGGTEVDITEAPYMTALVYYYPGMQIYIQRCVGPLISSWHVLTTAFCFTGANQENFLVRAGSTLSLSGGTTNKISKVLLHPDYVETPRQNDIAIVFVQDPFRISYVIKSLRLPGQNFTIEDGNVGDVSGWGFDKERTDGGTQHSTLQRVKLTKIPQVNCSSSFEGQENVTISDTVFCATAAGKGTCFGDSGAPYVVTIGDIQALLGVASYYKECGTTSPDIFTRVDRYSNWILDNAVTPN